MAMFEYTGNPVLRRILMDLGWSYRDLADAINERLAVNGRVHPTTVDNWVSKGRKPRLLVHQNTVCAVLADNQTVVTRQQLGWTGNGSAFGVAVSRNVHLVELLDGPWGPQRTLEIFDALLGRPPLPPDYQGEPLADSDLRSVTRPGSVLSPPVPQPPVPELPVPQPDGPHPNGPEPSGPRLQGPDLPTSAVDRLVRVAQDCAALSLTTGGGGMLASAEATLRSVVELIRHAPPGPHRRSLFAVAAELARVAGWCAYDEMVNDEAQLYYLAALRAAHTADDWVLVVDILGNLSTMMFFSGHFQDAMYLLGISDQEERRTLLPPALTALICARRARYYAVIQHAPQLRDAAVEALGLLSAPRPDPAAADTSPWASRLSIAEVHGMLGEAWLMLGRPQEAEPLLRSALELYPGDSLRDRANTMVRLGRCLMELGYSEDARTVVNDARTLIASGVRSARLNKNVDTYDRLYPGPTGPSQ